MNRRIVVEARTTTVDAANQQLDTWVEFKPPMWAEPRGLSGLGAIREQNGGMPISITRYSFRVRYNAAAGITNAHRVVELIDGQRGPVYAVTGVLKDLQGREWADIVCELGGNDG